MAACASSTPLQQRWDEAEAECGDASSDACVTLVCGRLLLAPRGNFSTMIIGTDRFKDAVEQGGWSSVCLS
ncbi:hypothetical protein D7X96_16050 [Corallococcus interemptor]|uniref:Uncharacterized protein n=1 Tax=Corallococcus interemptor TaxID=2316720 RepID=A0A3A8QMP0_9BACT|nr:hypothetical protein [Corallococcus interemptor]RKH69091.1 hypothetical protein D7X96_16050 [Corallococcus interemptor]